MRSPQQRGHRLDVVRIGLEPARTQLNRIRPPPSVENMHGLRGAASRYAVRFPKPMVKELPPQGEGRAEIVVEPKPELRFEIVRGEPGGAADRGASRTGWVIDEMLS
jgi:hypothetical protein